MLRHALIRLLGGDLKQPDHGEPHATLAALEARVSELEAVQINRALEWAETAEKIKRYLARISAVEGRAAAREKGTTTTDPTVAAVLKAKFPRIAEGG